MKELQAIEFRCPKCGHEWTLKVSGAAISPEQRCPNCKKYSDNCYKPYNFFTQMKKELN